MNSHVSGICLTQLYKMVCVSLVSYVQSFNQWAVNVKLVKLALPAWLLPGSHILLFIYICADLTSYNYISYYSSQSIDVNLIDFIKPKHHQYEEELKIGRRRNDVISPS